MVVCCLKDMLELPLLGITERVRVVVIQNPVGFLIGGIEAKNILKSKIFMICQILWSKY
jgi:hypothetical protein